MQKYIVLTCILLTTSATAMERTKKSANTTVKKRMEISEKREISIEIPYKLSHQSPEITHIHSQKYLRFMEEQADKKAINPKHPGQRHEDLTKALHYVGATLNATNDLINLKRRSAIQPYYSVSLIGDSFSSAGDKYTGSWDPYAVIPIAAGYALNTKLFKRILIIDDHVDQNPRRVKKYYRCKYDDKKDPLKWIANNNREYYSSGNGSLFYPKNNPKLSKLFNGKIITYDKIGDTTLWNFLHNEGKNIDLVFYNIDSNKAKYLDELKPNIFSLLQKLIPVVFIISLENNETTGKIHNYIAETAKQIARLTTR
jgi:hypothetical protein